MSLFKVCNWWSAQCPDTLENYDCASLLCCRLNLNSDDEKDYIIVGSHSGHLSIFYPNSVNNSSPSDDEDGRGNDSENNTKDIDNQSIHQKGYKPTDLVLETKLKSPILGLLVGKFSGNTRNDDNINQLVILHPQNLCIYSVTKIDGVAEHGSHTFLQLLMEHKFKDNKSAFSICKGNFGGVKGREFLCVTHLDSSLTFYEQDGINYECILPGDPAIPSILCYVPRTDSFIRINSCWELESFSYQNLSQSVVLKAEIMRSWSFCIGEYALDMIPVQVTNTKTSIMILGEHNLICVTDEGELQFIIKLDYSPKCFYSFVVGWYWEPSARLITAIISDSSSLLIYDESKLIWVAQYEDVPIVSIQRSNLSNLSGAIVTLHSNGYVQISYLGSEPYIFKVPPLNLQELNYDKCHQELLQLEEEIKNSIDLTDMNYINDEAENDLKVDFDIVNSMSFNSQKLTIFDNLPNELKENYNHFENDLLICSGKLQFSTRVHLEQIQISIITSNGIKCTKSTMTFNDVVPNYTEIIEMWFYPNEKIHVCTAKVNVIISFINKQNTPRIITKSAYLPLRMFYKLSSPQKDAAIKLVLTLKCEDLNQKKSIGETTITTGKIHKLSAIFEEFGVADDSSHALGLMMFLTGDIVTIVAAKNTNRFRLQSNSIEAMSMVLEAIKNYAIKVEADNIHNAEKLKVEEDKKNIKQKQQRKKHSKNLAITPPTLPIKEVMEIVLHHHSFHNEIRRKTDLMDALWNQFKLFQRSLKSKTEDDPTDGLMMLIEKNYDDLIAEGDHLIMMRANEKKIRADLSCAIALIHNLIICFDIDDHILNILKSTLSFPIEDWIEKSWEENMAPAFDLLNHYGPLNRNKSIPLDSQPSVSSTYFEFDRFKRHMTSVLERVCRITSDMKHHNQYKQEEQHSNLAPFTNQNISSKNKDGNIGAIALRSKEESLDNKNNNNYENISEMIMNKRMTSTSPEITAETTGKSEQEAITQILSSSSLENEFKGHLKTTFNNNNNNNDDDDDDEVLNESDWLNKSNEIATSIDTMLSQGRQRQGQDTTNANILNDDGL